MKVFICSSFPDENKLDLLRRLPTITFAHSRLTQVVVVDEYHETLCNRVTEVPEYSLFALSDLVNNNASNSRGDVSIDSEKVAQELTQAQSNWLSIDLGCHGTVLSEKMIEEVARVSFSCSSLAKKNIVFLVEPVLLLPLARKANAAFNILSTSYENYKVSLDIRIMAVTTRIGALSLPFSDSIRGIRSLIRLLVKLFSSNYRRT